MISALNQRLLGILKAGAKPVTCPSCHQRFKPFADQEVHSWSDLARAVPCPHCGRAYALSAKPYPAPPVQGSLPQPATSKIEKRPVADGQVLYHMPPSGNGGGLFFFAIIWNLFLVAFVALQFAGMKPVRRSRQAPPQLLVLLMIPFTAIGVGLAYTGVRMKYAFHLLFLGPEFIRLQRQLFGRRTTKDLPTAAIDRVELAEIYRQNQRPVYGIHVGAGDRHLRFGSALAEDEKSWMCAEITEFLRGTGNASLPPVITEPLSDPR